MTHADLRVTVPKQDCRQGFPLDSVDENPPANSGIQVLSLIQEDPRCHGAIKPTHTKPWVCAQQPEKHGNKKPAQCYWRAAPTLHNQRKAYTVKKRQPKINKNF